MSIFSIFKKKNEIPFPFHHLKVDMHSHLIPGIDDGAPDLESSLLLIQGLLDLGYQQLITTPHVMQDLYPNTPENILDGLKKIQNRLGDNIIQAGAEYYLDEFVPELLKKEIPLLTITKKWLLVEFGFIAAPIELDPMILQLLEKGYTPIIAHPERYVYFHQDLTVFHRLKEIGCLFQSNLLSFSGYYGDTVCKAAEKLAEQQLVDLLGTDLHHDKHLQALRSLKMTNGLNNILEKGVLNEGL